MRRNILFTAFFMAVAGASVASAEAALSIASSEEFGEYIVGPDGRPVYAFVTEGRAGDNLPALESCNKPCRERWPPVFVDSDLTVAEPLDPDLAAMLEDGGGKVAVYNSEPLFHFVMDEAGQEPVGQGIHSFGGWWYLISPDGEYIETGITPEVDG